MACLVNCKKCLKQIDSSLFARLCSECLIESVSRAPIKPKSIFLRVNPQQYRISVTYLSESDKWIAKISKVGETAFHYSMYKNTGPDSVKNAVNKVLRLAYNAGWPDIKLF